MIKCSVCGGEVDSIGNNQYRCRYCMHEFSESDFRTETKFHVEKRSNEGVNVFDKNIKGVLEITCRFPGAVSAGSGLLIDRTGYAITNTHVVTNEAKPCNDITVKIAGQSVRASIIALGDNDGGHGTGVDLALIKLSSVPYDATVVELGDFDNVRIGEQVYVIGNSLGHGTCITSGIVSDKSRNVDGQQLLMTDCAVNGGNSGGPMFNQKGLVIGVIVSGITGAEGMNFAIPVSTVKDFLSGRYFAAKMASGAFTGPDSRKTKCPQCGNPDAIYYIKNGSTHCSKCGYSNTPPRYFSANDRSSDMKDRKKALAPCPRLWCRSNDTWIENGLFVCNACGFVEGDKID